MSGHISETIAVRFRNNFVTDCINGILLGYDKMRSDNQYEIHWKENKLTAHLVAKMNETEFFADKSIIIIPQAPLYNNDINYGDADPDRAPVIDFKFCKSWSRLNFDYYAEAKNLSEQNWFKPGKTTPVRADKQIKRYIDTGIKHYLSGYYPAGFLLGYVVNGTVDNVVLALNRQILCLSPATRIGQINQDTMATRECCFSSENNLLDKVLTIRHLLLQLA